jgi:hypothetical protein
MYSSTWCDDEWNSLGSGGTGGTITEGDDDDDVIVLSRDLKFGRVTPGSSVAYARLVPLESVLFVSEVLDWAVDIKSRSVADGLIPSPIAAQYDTPTKISPDRFNPVARW